MGLDDVEVNRELLENKGRAHCVDFHHKRERHDIKYISFVEFAVLKHVGKEVVFGADLPVVLKVVHHLLLVRMVRHPLELNLTTHGSPLEVKQRVEVMRLNPVSIPSRQCLRN